MLGPPTFRNIFCLENFAVIYSYMSVIVSLFNMDDRFSYCDVIDSFAVFYSPIMT